jgi:hypothetical protein
MKFGVDETTEATKLHGAKLNFLLENFGKPKGYGFELSNRNRGQVARNCWHFYT